MKSSSKPTDIQTKLTSEYEDLFENSSNSVIVNVEWRANGDNFQKLSVYENYSPVRTSGNTIPFTKP